jgi:uncharacterized protein (DUF983 family)
MNQRRARAIFLNGLRLRCPRCGESKLFETFFKMRAVCTICHLHFEREPGYFVGAIYINYGVTVVLALVGFQTFEIFFEPTLTQQLVLWIVFATLFPLFFYRYSKSLWLSMDCWINPEPPTLRRVR